MTGLDMTYQLILFDFDGTLADSFPYLMNTFNEVAYDHRLKTVSPEEVETLRGYHTREVMQHFGIPFWRMPFLMAEGRARMAQDIDQIHLFDGIDRSIQELADRGKILGVVSSNSLENIRRVLGPETAKRVQYFEAGVSLLGKAPKIHKVIRKSKVPRSQVLFVGDEMRDIEAARKAGVACAVVAWGYTRVDALIKYHPDLVLEQIEDILKRIP